VQIKEALEAKGYAAFIFTNSATGSPLYTPDRVGKLLVEADYHLVLDTPNARNSKGVWIEAAMAAIIAKTVALGPVQQTGFGSNPRKRGGNDPPDKGEDPSNPTGGPTKPSGGPGGAARPLAKRFDKEAFLQGVKNSWIVAENPDIKGTFLVYGSGTDGVLTGLLYRAKVESDGTWTIYDPAASRDGSLGRRLGAVARPPGIDVDMCDCK
jgi:hypothetical protein